MAVAVETAETMTRMPKKTVEKSVLRFRRGLEDWRSSHKAKRREERTMKRVPHGACVLFNDPVAGEKPKVHTSESDRVTVAVIGGRSRVGKAMRTSTIQ